MSLRTPGPSADDIATLLRLAVRVPDHGKLAPWRFIVLEGPGKTAIANRLAAIAAMRSDATKAQAALGKFTAPPLVIAVVSAPRPGDIPEWDQLMSAGAVCLTLLNAATAMGYGANWITDWYAYAEETRDVFGLGQGERIAGFIYIGTSAEAPLERVRPNLDGLISRP